MLSRLAIQQGVGLSLARTASVQTRVCHHLAKNEKTSDNPFGKFKEGPERDLVNFPRRMRPLYPGKVRLTFVPEEWFQFFYKKTGVTGPYVFGAGLITYLFSKELWVIDHEFPVGIALIILCYGLVKKLGPGLTAYIDSEMDKREKALNDSRANVENGLREAIEDEKKSQWNAEGQKYLIEAKRENVKLQLEANYRKRLVTVYQEVKKRLDYQVELQNAARRIEQRHMAKWIVDNVMKGITPQQEKEALQLCVANLKRLASQPH